MGLILNPLTGQFDFVNFVPPGSGFITSTSDTNTVHLAVTATVLTADVKFANGTIDSNSSGIKVATGGITNNEINASAAISFSKLAPLTNAHILVGNAGNVATDVAVSGDLSLINTGAFTVNTVGGSTASNINLATIAANAATDTNTVGTIVKRDASGNFSAGIITATQLIDTGLTANTAIYANASKQLTSSVTTSTELGYLSGVTSNIQTQLDSKETSTLTNTHIFVGNASNIATDVALSGDASITNTGVLTVNSVGTSSAANIHTAELAANAATSSNTASTIVKRDASGNFSAGTISATRENISSFIEFTQTSTPSTPASTKMDLYVDSTQGFSRIRTIDETGLVTTVSRDSFNIMYNNSGSTIAKGSPIYLTGVNAGIGTIALAKADSITTSPAYGLTAESIANNSYGRVQFTGVISGIDTSAFSAGQIVYLSATTAGALTGTKPLAPNIAQTLAVVLTNAVSGSVTLTVRDNQNVSSGSNTGFALNVVALTDAATIATDVSLGNNFTVTLGGNRTLGNPTNSRSGQKVIWRIRQDGTGNRTLAYGSDFRFGTDILTPILTTVANKTDYIGAIYNSADAKWDVVAVVQGY